MPKLNVRVAALVLVACLGGCSSGEPLQVTSIQLGRSLNTDGTVAGHTTRFAPDDTVYASVLTSGAGSGVISVRWMFAGRVVLGERKKDVSFMDVAATEFHLQSSAGFPPGDYVVEAFLDGKPAGTREFRVEGPR
jgi:hypothetical protein